jgi:hypothetical protein
MISAKSRHHYYFYNSPTLFITPPAFGERIARFGFQNRYSSQPSYDVSNRKPCNNSINRYERFRRLLLGMTTDEASTLPHPNALDSTAFLHEGTSNLIDVGKHAFEVISSNRRSFNRSWKRMKPLLELILQSCRDKEEDDNDEKCIQPTNKVSSIADVGCDHGLLALSLACMSWVVSQQRLRRNTDGCDASSKSDDSVFDQVIGTDLSSLALENGGMVSYRKLIDAMTTEKQLPLPIEFRVGCGLEPLQPGEADAIVLAGMGHLTMLEVLFGKQVDDRDQHQHNLDADNIRPVDRIHARRIFLQPTNSRPQHMIELYDRVHESGDWDLKGETIACIGGRYYINAYFERNRNTNHILPGDTPFRFPGHFLGRGDLDQSRVYDSYVKHHLLWLKEDYERPKYMLEDEDRRWLEHIAEAEESLVSWYSQ